MIRYFISYAFQSPAGFGVATCELPLTKPIGTLDDVTAINQWLAGHGVENPAVVAFCPFDDVNTDTARRAS